MERAASYLLTLAAIVIAAVLVRREFFPPARGPNLVPATGSLEFDADWQSYLTHAVPAGQPVATVTLIEFVDIECPACRAFHLDALRVAREEFGDQLDVRFVHWPLPNHRFARPGAEAAECAAQQGRFPEYLDALFGRQDSLGLKSWTGYAADAGVPDTLAFLNCLRNPGPLRARIDSGAVTAERLGFFGTPTILANGWRFPAPPSSVRLREVIQDLVAGRDPRK